METSVREENDRLFGGLRGMQMQDYVTTVRTNLHNERTAEKKRKYVM